VNIGGTRKTDGTYIVKASGADATFVQIYNAATGETILWNNTLSDGDWLRLKSDGQTAEVSDDSGSTWTPSNGGMSGLVPQLQGGIDNAITVTGVTGTCAVNYYAMG